MTNPIIRIHDIETDSIVDRQMSETEYDSYLSVLAAIDEEKTNETLRAEQKAGLLARLGITEAEAELLLS